jgi:hypothetical protein
MRAFVSSYSMVATGGGATACGLTSVPVPWSGTLSSLSLKSRRDAFWLTVCLCVRFERLGRIEIFEWRQGGPVKMASCYFRVEISRFAVDEQGWCEGEMYSSIVLLGSMVSVVVEGENGCARVLILSRGWKCEVKERGRRKRRCHKA